MVLRPNLDIYTLITNDSILLSYRVKLEKLVLFCLD
jgi:hypothetical protein